MEKPRTSFPQTPKPKTSSFLHLIFVRPDWFILVTSHCLLLTDSSSSRSNEVKIHEYLESQGKRGLVGSFYKEKEK